MIKIRKFHVHGMLFQNIRLFIGKVVTLCIPIALYSCTSTSHLTFINVDATQADLEQVKEDTYQCTNYLNSLFKDLSPDITLKIYKNRQVFLRALVESGRIQEKDVFLYEAADGPKPMNGLFMLSPDLKGRKACHEIVHIYLDKYTSSPTGGVMWFHEGSAEYFSSVAFGRGSEKTACKVIKEGGAPHSFDQIQTRKQWMGLYKFFHEKTMIYSQSHLLIKYLIEKYGYESYFQLLKIANTPTFPENFEKVYKISLNAFIDDWKNHLQAKEDNQICH